MAFIMKAEATNETFNVVSPVWADNSLRVASGILTRQLALDVFSSFAERTVWAEVGTSKEKCFDVILPL